MRGPMRAKPKNHAKNLERLKDLSRTIHSSMEDGSFYELSYFERYRKIREIKKLYNKLLGSLSEASLRTAVSFASVLVLLTAPGCDDAAQGTATVKINPGVKGNSLAPVKSTAYVPPDVTGLTLTVSGPGIKTSTITVSPGEDSIMLAVPAGKDRVFSLRADTATIYFYFGRATVDLNNGDMINLPITMVRGPEFVAGTLPAGIGTFTRNTYPSFGDIDNDGDQDLLVSTEYLTAEYRVYCLTNTNGTFSSAALPTGIDTALDRCVNLADIDGDGDLDTVFSIGFNLLYRINNGTGFSSTYGYAGSYSGVNMIIPATGDIDQDGDADIFAGGTTYGSRDIQYIQNTTDENGIGFGAITGNPFGLSSIATNNSFSPALIDIDFDGDLDLFVVMSPYTTTSDVLFFENAGTSEAPVFAAPLTNPFSLGYINYPMAFPAFADIDRDGDQDLFVGTSNGTILYFENVIIP